MPLNDISHLFSRHTNLKIIGLSEPLHDRCIIPFWLSTNMDFYWDFTITQLDE